MIFNCEFHWTGYFVEEDTKALSVWFVKEIHGIVSICTLNAFSFADHLPEISSDFL